LPDTRSGGSSLRCRRRGRCLEVPQSFARHLTAHLEVPATTFALGGICLQISAHVVVPSLASNWSWSEKRHSSFEHDTLMQSEELGSCIHSVATARELQDTTIQASLSSSASGLLRRCVQCHRCTSPIPGPDQPSRCSLRPSLQDCGAKQWPCPPSFHLDMPAQSSTNNKSREWGILTSSLPSARPSRPLVSRPWLRYQFPSYRSVLRRLDPLRLSCSFFSFKKSPQPLSQALSNTMHQSATLV